MSPVKNIYNQIKFYLGKYGFFKTIKKCIKVAFIKIKRFIKGEKDPQYGDYGDWIRANEVGTVELIAQKRKAFENSPKIKCP